MLALLALMGIGATVALFSVLDFGGSDDNAGSGGLEFDEADDVVSDASYRAGFVSNFEDLVAEREITQAEADAALAKIEFTEGVQDIATQGGDDLVLLGAQADRIDAGAGADTVIGGAGDDTIRLGEGDDLSGSDTRTVTGTDDIISIGADFTLFAPDSITEGGDDTILGGAGADFIADGYGSNFLNGQQGRDILVAVDQDALSPDTVEGGFGDDVLFVDQGDVATGGRDNDSFVIDLFGATLTGYQPVTITDYTGGEDLLVLEGSADLLRAPAPTGPDDMPVDPVTVANVPGTTDAVISIGGVPVVIVQGGQGLLRADIRIST